MNHKRRADITISGSLNRRKIVLWFGICTIISIVAILLSQNEIYLDDWYIEACADGAFGENNRSLLVLGSNFLLTGIIYALSLTGLRLFWLHWILLFANYVSYLMVGWILFECLEIKRASFVTALYGIIVAPLISFEFQFTTTAAVTIASGCLFMMYAIERRKKKRWYIFSTIWIVFGAAMRVDCIVYSVAFFGIVWLKKLIDTIRKMPKGHHEKIQEFFRRLIPLATALFLCFGVEVAQHVLMSRANPGFYDWNNSRTLVDDYEHPDYFANEAAYQRLGVSYTDFLLLCSWNNQDPDFFTQDLYENLHEIKSNTSESTESDLSAVMTVRNAMLSNDYLWIALLVGGIVGIFFEWKIAVTLGGMFTAAVAFYVYFEQIGRLIWRTEWPIWICFITALIILLQGEKLRLPVTQMGRIKKTCTRYGNVMASRGSVIPLWVEQMMEGKPITITDPNMTRFMMTLDDAVDLVIYAFQHGHNGDLFVQKAPAATLSTLAEALKQTYAKVNPKYGETEVKVIGTRHGEKLYETLVTREEMSKAIDMGNYYRIPCDTRDLNYDKFFTEGSEDVSKIEDYHSHNTRRLDVEGMKEQLLRLRFVREDLGLITRAKPRDIRSE